MILDIITPERALQVATWLWDLLLMVWLVLWFRSKQAKKRESPWERLQHVIPVLTAFWLLYQDHYNFWNVPLLPAASWVLWIGLLLTALGVGISVWARLSLGANWSGMVTLKQDHELVRNGLYRWIRHPIYTGILAGFVGTAMIKDHLRAWIGLVVLLGSFYFKARREERFLCQEFGPRFEEHLRRTGMFLPRLG